MSHCCFVCGKNARNWKGKGVYHTFCKVCTSFIKKTSFLQINRLSKCATMGCFLDNSDHSGIIPPQSIRCQICGRCETLILKNIEYQAPKVIRTRADRPRKFFEELQQRRSKKCRIKKIAKTSSEELYSRDNHEEEIVQLYELFPKKLN